MKVIKPSVMDSTLLIDHNVVEIHPVWSSTTTYAKGDLVVHDIAGTYESLVNSNLNNHPETELTSWLRVGPTNLYAMFDTQISTVSTGTLSLSATVKTGSIDSIALLNLVGSKVTLTIRNGYNGPIIYGPVERSLQGTNITNWFDYFYFDEEDQRTQAIFLDLPVGVLDAHATFEVTSTAEVSIGAFVFGKIATLGKTEYGITTGITDYSTKEVDIYGTTTFVIREYSKRITADLQIDNHDLNKVQRTLFALRAKPAVWIASDDARYEESAVVFGFYKDFSTSITYPTISRCSLEIEGLI